MYTVLNKKRARNLCEKRMSSLRSFTRKWLSSRYCADAGTGKSSANASREALIEMIQVLWQEEDVDLAVEDWLLMF